MNASRILIALAASTLLLGVNKSALLHGSPVVLNPVSDTEPHGFGQSVAIDGTTAIVGAQYSDDGCPEDESCNSGAAFIFDVETGEQIHKLMLADSQRRAGLGRNVGIGGGIAIVTGGGYAYLFDTATGEQIHQLRPEDGEGNNSFGASVDVDGSTAIVGAPTDKSSRGAAYIFDVQTGQQLHKIVRSDGRTFNNFGSSVAVSGDRAIVGNPNFLRDGSPGKALVFDVSTGKELMTLTGSRSSSTDHFGTRVDIAGNLAVVVAFGDPRAYVFDVATGEELFAVYGLGWRVATDGSLVIIGAPKDYDVGSAYVINPRTGRTLLELGQPSPAEGKTFGTAVGIDNNHAIVGEFVNTRFGADPPTHVGSAYIFVVPEPSGFCIAIGLALGTVLFPRRLRRKCRTLEVPNSLCAPSANSVVGYAARVPEPPNRVPHKILSGTRAAYPTTSSVRRVAADAIAYSGPMAWGNPVSSAAVTFLVPRSA